MLHCHVMASPTQKQHQHLPNLYGGGATTAPPPTPSTQAIDLLSTPDAADTLSKLLHRLPPTLTLPSRRTQSTACPQTVSLSEKDQLVLDKVRSAGLEHGYFQLTDHSIISQLAKSAESEALALFNLPKDQKGTCCPKNWPLGYQGNEDEDDDVEDGGGLVESFCLDGSCSIDSTHLPLASVKEFTRELEKLGLKVADLLCKAMGLDNPIGENPTRFCSLMWLTEATSNNKAAMSGGAYPFIVGLQYQIRCQKYSLLADSGWISVLPHVDAVMVTIGDIPRVWSNGKLKKVRGRPLATLSDSKESRCMTMSLLITLPTESTVSPIFPQGYVEKDEDDESIDDDHYQPTSELREERLFKSFSFEDYAWRVCHERLLFKDPLDRYRI